jgi:probable rRNA maturation factor
MTATEINIDINCDNDRWHEVIPDIDLMIERTCKSVINATGIQKFAKVIEVSVMLADDNFVQDLNKEYRGKDNPTNVLSFPSEEFTAGDYEQADEFVMLGDIAIALETIEREAIEQDKDIKDHLTHMVVHGTLHLLGYDHIEDEEAEDMEGLEVKILEDMEIENPYL